MTTVSGLIFIFDFQQVMTNGTFNIHFFSKMVWKA